MAGFLFLAAKRHQADLAEQLSLQSLAARGKPEAIRKQLKDWDE